MLVKSIFLYGFDMFMNDAGIWLGFSKSKGWLYMATLQILFF